MRNNSELFSFSSNFFLLIFQDGDHLTRVTVNVRVKDVQNTPPVFTGSMSGRVSEDAPVGSLVMIVQARDGDLGNPRDVKLSLMSSTFPSSTPFSFNNTTISGVMLKSSTFSRSWQLFPTGQQEWTLNNYATTGQRNSWKCFEVAG